MELKFTLPGRPLLLILTAGTKRYPRFGTVSIKIVSFSFSPSARRNIEIVTVRFDSSTKQSGQSVSTISVRETTRPAFRISSSKAWTALGASGRILPDNTQRFLDQKNTHPTADARLQVINVSIGALIKNSISLRLIKTVA